MAGEATAAVAALSSTAQSIQQIISIFSGSSGCSKEVRNAVNHVTVAANRNLRLAEKEIGQLLTIGSAQAATIVRCTHHTVPALQGSIANWRAAYGRLQTLYRQLAQERDHLQTQLHQANVQRVAWQQAWQRQHDMVLQERRAINRDERALAAANSQATALHKRLTACEARPPSHASCCDCKDAIGQC
jgi:hypothetical protein